MLLKFCPLFSWNSNPNTGSFTIHSNCKNINMVVYNLNGMEVLSESLVLNLGIATINTSLANGVYMIKFIGSDGTSKIEKLIINDTK